MQYLNVYLQKINNRGNEALSKSIQKTANDVSDKAIGNFSFVSHDIGLLLGNVQSGKTGQVFGAICKATDMGFPAFVLLTTDNIVLQQQTLERVKTDLEGYCICGENDSGLFIQNSLVQPVIVVLKKNARVLRLWANVFSSTGFMKGNPLFIVDDEADAASLNTLVNKDRQSSINKYLDIIKNGASSSIYLQVTATPQAIFLQTVASNWHPNFVCYFNPGAGYLGGDFFFPRDEEPDCISFNERIPDTNRAVFVRHLAVSSQLLASGAKVSNCLVHPSVRQAVHESFEREFRKELKWCKDNISGDFKEAFREICINLHPLQTEVLPFNLLYNYAQNMVENDEVNILVMNAKNDVSTESYSTGCNIVIGGNTLGRGVTFPGLHTIFYTRSAKKPQADTMWQHSRMFGYDRDPGLMMVYIDQHLYKLFADINKTNNSIIAQVERGNDSIQVSYSSALNPTRKNVLDNKHVTAISGGSNYYPFYPDNNTIEDLDKLLAPFEDTQPTYQVSIRLILAIFKHIKSEGDFNVSAFADILESMLANEPAMQGVLIVRRSRNVSQGTGALLSPNDWSLGASIGSKVVLTMYKVTGEKGWGGRQLWVPNIKLPEDIIYYTLDEGEYPADED
jgi:hypothetical protein